MHGRVPGDVRSFPMGFNGTVTVGQVTVLSLPLMYPVFRIMAWCLYTGTSGSAPCPDYRGPGSCVTRIPFPAL
jgi:hypothetical protein